MNTTKTLMLAAVTALSLGVGSAMAQGLTPSSAEGAYFSGQRQAAPKIVNQGPQAGSSDVNTARPAIGHVVPFNGDYGDAANPG